MFKTNVGRLDRTLRIVLDEVMRALNGTPWLDLSSQEEVDQLIQELTQMFASMTPEELAASSVTMSEEELMEMLSEMDEMDEADSQPAEPTGLMHFPAPSQLQ